MSEEATRRRCFITGKLVGEKLANLYREMRLLETSPRWPSILPVEEKVKFELDVLDDVNKRVNQAFTGFADGYPRCFSPRMMACWGPSVDAVRESMEKRDWGEAAERTKFGLEECLGLGMLGVTVTTDIAELEYILRKKLKGEELPASQQPSAI